MYTATSRKVVGKSARDNPERYWGGLKGGFEFIVLQRNLIEWHERPWTYVCESERKATKVGSTATVVRNSVLVIPHITFRDRRVHIFSDNLSRNSCVLCRCPVDYIRRTWNTKISSGSRIVKITIRKFCTFVLVSYAVFLGTLVPTYCD